jgi:D-cysteine desulfhydrase
VEGDALERVRIRGEFFGGGYARPGRGTVPAMQRFAAVTGARADSCYSGKALAALYADLETGALRGEAVLYWHTLSARRLPPGVTVPAAPAVPEALRGYFSGAGPEA